MTQFHINGIQQIGIGVTSMPSAWKEYRKLFGMDVPVFSDEGEAPFMTRYTGGQVHSRTASLAVNLNGGSGFEIWQYTSRTPAAPKFEPRLGDLGILAIKIKSPDPHSSRKRLLDASGSHYCYELESDPSGRRYFFLRDSAGNLFQVSESSDWFKRPEGKDKGESGGPTGCIIGVSDIDRSLSLYRDLLAYNKVIYDKQGIFPELFMLSGGKGKFRRILLEQGHSSTGAFGELLGRSKIELIQSLDEWQEKRAIFKERFWGDLGYIHLCFDVRGMDGLKAGCEESGFPFTVDSDNAFDMGEASGRFAYIEDPDGTLIEFVETKRVPVIKKLGFSINLERRNTDKGLPRWMIKALSLGRVRD